VASQPKADLFEVTGINIRVAEGTVTIYWRKSLRVEGGAATEVARGSHVEQAATLGAMFPDGSRSYHQNLKELAYGRLQAAGVFPPGALA
jgi:hypothetical protein